jgi:hypothetical protein
VAALLRHTRALLLAACFLSGVTLPAQPFPNTPQASQVKAAHLYNLAKFVDWPEEPPGGSGPLVITVYGDDPVGPTLEHFFSGKTVNGRPLIVRRTSRVEELLPCHLLFISSSDRKRLGEVLQAVGNAAVLTVGETEAFTQLGGAVQFILEGGTVQFRINTEATRRSGLRISSKLLSLGKAARN